MIVRSVDEQEGIVFVTIHGRCTMRELAGHYRKLRGLIADRRARGLPVRVLTDVVAAAQRDAALESYARQQIKRLYRPADRVAILVADAAHQRHVRTVLADVPVATFTSRLPAEMWLLLDDVPKPA